MKRVSLRARLTAAVAVLVMLVVAAAGLVIAARIDHRDRADVDRQLLARAEKVRADASKLLGDEQEPGRGTDDEYGELLSGSDSLVRLLSDGGVVAQRGDQPQGAVPLPAAEGFSTVMVGGYPWRSLVQPLDASGSDQLQVLQSLEHQELRLEDNRRIAAGVAVLAALLAGLAVWLLVGLVLRPLRRLRDAAVTIGPGDTRQLPQVSSPAEVADLSGTLNAMLHRLQEAMLATRRFTADAGHEMRTPLTSLGMDLESLHRNPDLPPEARARMLAAMTAEHQRLVSLLDGLQALARGDAGALPEHQLGDVTDIVADAVDAARRRHPTVTFTTRLPDSAVMVDGWSAGLRLAVDNLLSNAALHGRPGGHVEATVTVSGAGAVIAVADDGPGIPAADRAAMKERFTRGPMPQAEGSGLGLALVKQQATIHHGQLKLATSAAGGLLATIDLPTAGNESVSAAEPK